MLIMLAAAPAAMLVSWLLRETVDATLARVEQGLDDLEVVKASLYSAEGLQMMEAIEVTEIPPYHIKVWGANKATLSLLVSDEEGEAIGHLARKGDSLKLALLIARIRADQGERELEE